VQREHVRDKERERERKRRKNRKYGQAKLKHAKRGIISCVISATVCLLLVAILARAYTSGGNAAPFIGGVGLVSLILAGYGLYMGVRGFKEREKNYITCKIGVGCSAFFIFGFILIFCRGLF